MAQIKLEFDNKLEKSEIIVPLISSSKKEAGENYLNSDKTDKAQTSVFGIQVPLIKINSTVIDFDAIHYFDLKSEGKLPELSMIVEDRYELINNIDKPSHKNEVRVQIIPQIENTYKKIDLTFYISSIKVNGSLIKITCSYKSPDLISSRFESFGQIDTYNIFKNAANSSKLGFATNITESNDKRYIYCDNKSWIDLLDSEIQFSNTDNCILDWWVDFWDNINLADIKERYTSIDSDDDMLIWVRGQVNEIEIDIEPPVIKTPAVIHNHPGNNMSELFVKDYNIENNTGIAYSHGTDKVFGVYEDSNDEYLDYLIQDGDVKEDIFTKYEYLGENYGDYNYLLAKHLRSGYLQKISTEKVKVTLQAPNLGLMRGHKVNFIRYVNSDAIEGKLKALEDNGVIDRNVESNIPLNDYEITEDGGNGMFRIDKTCSAQYLIYGVDIQYNNNAWNYILTLVKPASDKVNIMKEE